MAVAAAGGRPMLQLLRLCVAVVAAAAADTAEPATMVAAATEAAATEAAAAAAAAPPSAAAVAAQYLQDVRAHLSEEDFADFMEVLQGHAAGRYSDDVVRQYGDVFFAAAPQLKARLTSLVPEVSEGTPPPPRTAALPSLPCTHSTVGASARVTGSPHPGRRGGRARGGGRRRGERSAGAGGGCCCRGGGGGGRGRGGGQGAGG
eukprot:COSAG01_NODE_25421_length_745_cov_5.939628_1_plen_203_part_01